MQLHGPAEASRPRYAQYAHRGETAEIAASSAVIRRVLRWRRHGRDDHWCRTGVQRRGPQEQLFGTPFVLLLSVFAPPRHPKILLQSASAPHQRVGNVVSFPARIRTSANSKRLGNGGGVLESRTYVLGSKTCNFQAIKIIIGSLCCSL